MARKRVRVGQKLTTNSGPKAPAIGDLDLVHSHFPLMLGGCFEMHPRDRGRAASIKFEVASGCQPTGRTEISKGQKKLQGTSGWGLESGRSWTCRFSGVYRPSVAPRPLLRWVTPDSRLHVQVWRGKSSSGAFKFDPPEREKSFILCGAPWHKAAAIASTFNSGR